MLSRNSYNYLSDFNSHSLPEVMEAFGRNSYNYLSDFNQLATKSGQEVVTVYGRNSYNYLSDFNSYFVINVINFINSRNSYNYLSDFNLCGKSPTQKCTHIVAILTITFLISTWPCGSQECSFTWSQFLQLPF